MEVPNILTVVERSDMARERWLEHSAAKYVMTHIWMSHVPHTDESWTWLTWHASAGSATLPPSDLYHIYACGMTRTEMRHGTHANGSWSQGGS